MEVIRTSKKVVSMYQTLGGAYNSIPLFTEAQDFSNLSGSEQIDYLDYHFRNKGHGEGAENLCELSNAINYGYIRDEIIVIVEDVPNV